MARPQTIPTALLCDRGSKADGDSRIKIVCKAGFELGDDSTCERVQTTKPDTPVASRTPTERTLSPEPSGDRRLIHGVLPGESAAGTIPPGARVLVQSKRLPQGPGSGTDRRQQCSKHPPSEAIHWRELTARRSAVRKRLLPLIPDSATCRSCWRLREDGNARVGDRRSRNGGHLTLTKS